MAASEHTLRLRDGRQLAYCELGDPSGLPWFFFHGTPGSRLVLGEHDGLARIPGLRLILPERPGYGLSDPLPDRNLLGWGDDVAEMADHLRLDRFAVGGISGGGPHALASAHRLGERVTRVLLLSSPAPLNFPGALRGMAPGNRLGVHLERLAPWLMRRLMQASSAAFANNPEAFLDAMAVQMGEADGRLLRQPALRAAIAADLREAYRQGADAQIADGRLAMTSRGWGFELRAVRHPVFLWHGEADRLVPVAMARHLAGELPNCHARFVADAGHLLTESEEVVSGIRKVLLG